MQGLGQDNLPYLFGTDPIDIARGWLEFAEILWTSDIRQEAAITSSKYAKTFGFFCTLADFWLNMKGFDKVVVVYKGVRLRLPIIPGTVVMNLWRLFVEFERWNAPLDVVRRFLAELLGSKATLEMCLQDEFDAVYAKALTEQLISDARKNQVYAPQGAFFLDLPANLPVQGLDRLDIQVTEKGMWVLANPAMGITFWQIDRDIPEISGDEDPNLLAAYRLILTAIWHDLVIGGPKVIAHQRSCQASPSSIQIVQKDRHRHRGKSGSTRPLVLPTQRVLSLDGVHSWGTEEELEKIRRQAHQVRGHARRLMPGWQRSLTAAQNAQRFSFIIPDGYTFVQPYQTGLKDPTCAEDIETPIVARGLASVILMGKFTRRQS